MNVINVNPIYIYQIDYLILYLSGEFEIENSLNSNSNAFCAYTPLGLTEFN